MLSPDEARRRTKRAQRFGAPSAAGEHHAVASRFEWGEMNLYVPKSGGQEKFQQALANDARSIVIGIGKAGTGKTLFAVQAR